MSIQLYPKIGGSNGGRSAVSAETGAAITSAYAEYALKITVRTGTAQGARRSSIVEFGCQGSDQDACDLQAGLIAQAIENASKGYITSFVKKMGKFRQDDDGTAIPIGTSQYGVITWTNGILEGQQGPNVFDEMKGQIYIPFVDVDTMAGTALTTITNLITTNKLARAKFQNDSRNSFTIATSQNRSAVKILDYRASSYGTLSSNDNSAGISDGVLRDDAE